MRTPFKFATAAGVCASLTAAVPAFSQARETNSDRYSLMQLSIPATHSEAAAFGQQTAALTNCKQARDLAKKLEADVRRDRYVMAHRLPVSLRDTLADIETGYASEVFTNDGTTLRVLVICNRV